MGDVDSFSHLWDGTDLGWVLVQTYKQTIQLSLVFQDGDPSVQDVKAARKVIPFLASLSAKEALSHLRGKASFDIGEFDSREARSIVHACRALDLSIIEHVHDKSTCFFLNEIKNTVAVIEDTLLHHKVVEEALRRGLPTRHVEA